MQLQTIPNGAFSENRIRKYFVTVVIGIKFKFDRFKSIENIWLDSYRIPLGSGKNLITLERNQLPRPQKSSTYLYALSKLHLKLWSSNKIYLGIFKILVWIDTIFQSKVNTVAFSIINKSWQSWSAKPLWYSSFNK